MEAMYDAPTLFDMPFNIQMMLKMIRNPLFGSLLVQGANVFVKKMIPDMILRKLSKEELDYYASPFPTFKSRKPILEWPKAVPFDGGKPLDVAKAVASWNKWLFETEIPKLFFYVTPGVAIKEKDVKIIKDNMKSLTIIYLGAGLHFVQEDYPHEIGEGISNWYKEISI